MHPTDRRYSKDHEWIKMDGDTGTVGITDFAQGELGDIVYVEVPEAGKKVKTGEAAGTVESVKAVSEIYSPVQGRIRIYTAEPLDVIGWSSVTPVVRQRTASARAVLDCRLAAVEGLTLRKLCDEDCELGYKIMRRVANVVAARLMITRLQLLDVYGHPQEGQ